MAPSAPAAKPAPTAATPPPPVSAPPVPSAAVPAAAPPAPAAAAAPGGRVYVSPMAKRLAEQRNIRLQGKNNVQFSFV